MREIELRLSGHAGPPGELRADHAARIGETLQSLVLRLTREAAGAAGLGRPVRVLEQIGEVRLAGVAEGSTRLIYRVGDSTSLDVDPLSDAVDAMFVEIVDGMAHNRRPTIATDTIAQAVDDFAGALQKSARHVSASLSGAVIADIPTQLIDRHVWQSSAVESTQATLVGTLEALDLHNDHFRLRDDVGNPIELIDVVDSRHAAGLAGRRVAASGEFVPAIGSGRSRVERANVAPYEPDERYDPRTDGPDGFPAPGRLARLPEDLALTDAELDDFLAAIHG